MSKQESVSDWMELAKAYDKAEKETIQPYVIVSIEDQTTKEKLHKYDIPREMFWRYEWVIRWRKARLQCQRPKHMIVQYISPYDKVTGLDLGFGSLISKLTSAKAQVTILENKIVSYKERMKDDLFFNEENDDIIRNLKCKIEIQKQKQRELGELIKDKISTLNPS